MPRVKGAQPDTFVHEHHSIFRVSYVKQTAYEAEAPRLRAASMLAHVDIHSVAANGYSKKGSIHPSLKPLSLIEWFGIWISPQNEAHHKSSMF
jgi:hypothetical protein